MTEPWRRPHVVGFIVQCSVCPQKAVIDTQPEADWVCPRCRDAHAGFGDIDVARAEPVATSTPDRRTHQCSACGQWDGHRTGCSAIVATGQYIGLAAEAEAAAFARRSPAFDDDYPIGGVTA